MVIPATPRDRMVDCLKPGSGVSEAFLPSEKPKASFRKAALQLAGLAAGFITPHPKSRGVGM